MNIKDIIIATTVCLSVILSQPSFAAEKATETPKEKEATADVANGEKIYKNFCVHCHQVSAVKTRIGAPSLINVLSRHDEKWIDMWIKSPDALVLTDHKAMELSKANEHGMTMPTLPIMQDEKNRRDVIGYLKTLK